MVIKKIRLVEVEPTIPLLQIFLMNEGEILEREIAEEEIQEVERIRLETSHLMSTD